jgi:hypothetical protein
MTSWLDQAVEDNIEATLTVFGHTDPSMSYRAVWVSATNHWIVRRTGNWPSGANAPLLAGVLRSGPGCMWTVAVPATDQRDPLPSECQTVIAVVPHPVEAIARIHAHWAKAVPS